MIEPFESAQDAPFSPGKAQAVALPGAGARIAMISVHTSPLALPGSYAAGGMNVYIRETAKHLARLGYTVDIFTRDDGSCPTITSVAPGVRLVSLTAGPRRPIPKEQVPEHLPEFVHALRSFRQYQDLHYDLIHSHYWHAGWVARLLAPRWGVPHVTMFHTLGEVKNRARLSELEPDERIDSERRIVSEVNRIVCAGEHERRLLVELYDADPQRVAVVPCGVDLRRFRPLNQQAARKALGLSDDPLVLFVGRVEPLKGIDILVEAMAMIERRDARLLVVGGDDQAAGEVSRLRARAEQLRLDGRIRFVGAVEQSRLPTYYNAADVCVVPSFYESFGLVAVEAMACGVPVVASRVGGLTGTIRDGETGYLIPWRCPEPFAERIDLLLENDELRRNLGKAAHQATRGYGWRGVASRLAAEYTRLWQEQAYGVACHGSRTAAAGAASPHEVCEAR